MKKILPLFMALIVLIFAVVPVSAANENADTLGIPNPNSVWTDNVTYPYALIVRDGGTGAYSLYLSKEPIYYDMDISYDSGSSTLGVPVGYRRYYLTDGVWTLNVASSGSVAIIAGFTAVWTSHDIVYNDPGAGSTVYFPHESDFFPIPLWGLPQALTAETMEAETIPALAGVMMTLVACGVGLMACLVALNLFGKRSQIFHL